MTTIDYHEGSNLLKSALNAAVAHEGLTFSEALDVHTECVTGVLRAAIDLRRSVQDAEAEPVVHHPACVKYGDDSGCDACNR